MRRLSPRVRWGLGTAVAALLCAAAFHAWAAPGDAGSAAISTPLRTVSAGQDIRVTFTVVSQSAQPFNWIAFYPGPELTLKTTGSAPGGWTGSLQPGRYQFSGGSLGPTQTATFGVDVKVEGAGGVRPALDASTTWQVAASSDDGTSLVVLAVPDGDANAQKQTIRVLKLDGTPRVLGPSGATDGTVTAGQGGIQLQTGVTNLGSSTLDVQLSLVPGNASVDAMRVVTVPPGQTVTSTFTGSVGSTGGSSFVPSARTADGKAIAIGGVARTFTVQAQPTFACSTFTPTAVNGTAPVTFSTLVGGSGAFPLHYDASLRISSSPPFDSPSKTIIQSASTYALTLPPTTIPATVPEGSYVAVVNFSGTDNNDYAFTKGFTCASVKVDRTPPAVTIDPPTLPALGVPEEPAARQTAVKPGDQIVLKATALEGGTANCQIKVTHDVIRMLDASGNVTSTSNVTSAVTVTTLPGKCTLTWKPVVPTIPPGAVALDIQLTVADLAGNEVNAFTTQIKADAVAPQLASAKTLSTTSVEIAFDDCVHGSSYFIDWTAGIYRALDVTTVPCSNGTGYRSVRLLIVPMLSDTETPRVAYAQTIPDAAAPVVAAALSKSIWYVDGAGWRLGAASVTAANAIGPPQPKLTGVSPGSAFSTNGGADKRPTFTVESVRTGEQACVDEQGMGRLGCAVAGSSGVVSIKSAVAVSGADRDLHVSAVAYNAAGIPSIADEHVVRYDTSPPVLAHATIADNAPLGAIPGRPDAIVTVEWSEDLVARTAPDTAEEWRVIGANGSAVSGASVTHVERCTMNATRCFVVWVEDTRLNAWRDAVAVAYVASADPYRDAATNAAPADSRTPLA